MENKDSSIPTKEENQSSLLLDSNIINANPVIEDKGNNANPVVEDSDINLNPVIENIEIKNEESIIIEHEETDPETPNHVSSELLTLKEYVDLLDKESKNIPDENKNQLEDIIDRTVNNKMSLNSHLPNDDKNKSLVDEPPIMSCDPEIQIISEDCVRLDLTSIETPPLAEKNTDSRSHLQQNTKETALGKRTNCTPHFQEDNTSKPRISNKNKEIRPTDLTDNYDFTTASSNCKINRTDIITLSENNYTNANPVVEDVEIKNEESHIIGKEGTELETLNLVLSEPFTLEGDFNVVDKESKDMPNENSKTVQDMIDTTSNNDISLNRHLPNDQIKSLVEISPIKNDEKNGDSGIQVSGEDCVKLDLNTPVARSSKRKKPTRPKGITDDYDCTTHKKNRKDISISSEITPSSKESSGISTLGDDSNINKKLKCLNSKGSKKCMEMDFKIKSCSIVLEKTIANHMKANDVVKVCQMKNHKIPKYVIANAQQSSATDSTIRIPSRTEQESTNINLDNTLPHTPTKDHINTRYSNLVTQNLSGLQQNYITHPKQTYDETPESLPEVSIPKIISLEICKKMMESRPQTVISPPCNNKVRTTDTQMSQENQKESKPQKVISPPCNKKTKITDRQISQDNKKESISQIIESIKGNKALTIQPVDTKKLLRPDLTYSPLPTFSEFQNKLKPKVPLHTNCANVTLPSSKMLPKEQIRSSRVQPKETVNLEELLDGAPPFIQEVLKCDNIRDGFINEDLIFVLSLLPDMEEMADNEKIQFQLRVIELITDVLTDPVLKS